MSCGGSRFDRWQLVVAELLGCLTAAWFKVGPVAHALSVSTMAAMTMT
jgi:hypothetical protein